MSEEFFPGLGSYMAEQQEKKDKTYGVRILKKIIKRLNPEQFKKLTAEAGSDFGFEWFNETQHPPTLLNTKKLNGITLSNLLSKTFLAGKVAQAYFAEYESYGAAQIGTDIGVVFPIDSSQWVITDGNIEVRGSAYMQLHGNSDDVSSLSVIRLDDFIDGWKRQGYVL